MLVSGIINLMDSVTDYSYSDIDVAGACIDSRKVRPGNIFFACKGSHMDGNSYAREALDNGAVLAVMDDPEKYKALDGNKVLVKDSIAEIKNVGRKRLNDCCLAKIAVTGSYGKTSTKEMIKAVLSCSYNVYSNWGNQNNELGVCLTAVGIPMQTDIVVYEVGTNAPGEIALLSNLIRPGVVVITGVGHAHIGNFGNIEAVAGEKLSIINSLGSGGIVVAGEMFKEAVKNMDAYEYSLFFGRTMAADVRLLDCVVEGTRTHFTVATADGEYPAVINYPYPHLAENFLAAVTVGKLYNISYADIIAAAADYKVPKGRGNIIKSEVLTIIDDSYNASLESVEKAMESLSYIDINPKYFILGGIAEISGFESKVYDELYSKAKSMKDIKFILSGGMYNVFKPEDNIIICPDDESTLKAVEDIKTGVVCVKASRSFRFEKYVEILKDRNNAI